MSNRKGNLRWHWRACLLAVLLMCCHWLFPILKAQPHTHTHIHRQELTDSYSHIHLCVCVCECPPEKKRHVRSPCLFLLNFALLSQNEELCECASEREHKEMDHAQSSCLFFSSFASTLTIPPSQNTRLCTRVCVCVCLRARLCLCVFACLVLYRFYLYLYESELKMKRRWMWWQSREKRSCITLPGWWDNRLGHVARIAALHISSTLAVYLSTSLSSSPHAYSMSERSFLLFIYFSRCRRSFVLLWWWQVKGLISVNFVLAPCPMRAVLAWHGGGCFVRTGNLGIVWGESIMSSVGNVLSWSQWTSVQQHSLSEIQVELKIKQNRPE